MEKIAKSENNDVKKSIIRTTIKNENLLARKMEMDKIRKKGNKKLNNALKHKSDRGTKVEGILATKIQQSIDRAKFVQHARKSGWDQINKSINIRPSTLEKEEPAKTQAQIEQEQEDEYVKQFYTNDSEAKEEEKKKVDQPKNGNVFALLDEAEA